MAFECLELGIEGAPACPDTYEPDASLLCPGAKKLNLQVQGNGVKVQIGTRVPGQGPAGSFGGVNWQPHESFFPCAASLVRTFDAVRVKNLIPGQPAQVLISVET